MNCSTGCGFGCAFRLVLAVMIAALAGSYFDVYHKATTLYKQKQSVVSVSGMDSEYVTGGQVLVKANGKPYVSEDSFNKKLKEMLESSPYTKGIDLNMLPGEVKKNFLNDWLNFLVIKDVWGKSGNIEDSSEFKEALQERTNALRDSLMVDMFVRDLRNVISTEDADLEKAYQENKDRFVKAPGQAHVVIAKFKGIAEAETFFRKATNVKTAEAFMTLANEEDTLEVKDYESVSSDPNATSDFNPKMKKAVFAKPNAPRVDLLYIDNAGWVIHVSDMTAPEAYAFEDVKDQVKMVADEAKYKEILDVRLAQMRKEANIEIDESFFKSNVRVLSPEDLQRAIKTKEQVDQDNDSSDDASDMTSDDNSDMSDDTTGNM